MYYPIDAGANTRFFQPPPFVPPMMQQFQPPTQQQQPQQPGYWIYCPPTVKPVMGSPAPYSGFSNVRPQQPITSSVRDNSKKENKLAQVYKTELCRQFTDYGRCNYGNRCGYAHGEEELRLPPPRAPKFRTEVCAVFTSEGHCPNGDRCHFVHDNSTLSWTSKVSTLPRSYLTPSPSSTTSSPSTQLDFSSNDLSFWPSVHSLAVADYSPNYTSSFAE